jgi:hypothetical protein
MIQPPLDVLDPQRSQLRSLAASVDKHVAELSAQGYSGEAAENLKLAWLALTKALALGPEPVLRGCPSCSRRIPCEATRCRYCMAESQSSVSAGAVGEHGT